MPQARPIEVLVLGGDELGRLAASAAELSPDSLRVWTETTARQSSQIRVVLADRPIPLARLRAALGRHASRSAFGWVVVGAVAPADAQLPADAQPREVALACRVTAAVARWRRRHRANLRATGRLRKLSLLDPLTGVANRRAWDKRLAAACKALARSSSNDDGREGDNDPDVPTAAFCVALFDVDRFKRVNDEAGHTAGDALAAALGRLLANNVRDGDFVARIGGDEFALLLAGLPANSAAKVIDRIRQEVSTAAATEAQLAEPIALSAGWTASQPGDTPAKIYARADQALLEAKSAGKNQTRP